MDSNEDCSILAQAILEANFIWIVRILKISFLYPFQKRSTQIIGNIFLSLCTWTPIVATILKIVGIERENRIGHLTMVECIFQMLSFLTIAFSYFYMALCKKKIYACAVLIIQMWRFNSQDTRMAMTKALQRGYYFWNFLSVSMFILCISYGVTPVAIPSFLNWALPGNRTYEKTLPFQTELLLSEDEFFYEIFTGQLILLSTYSVIISSINGFQFISLSYIIGQIRVMEYFLHKMDIEYKMKSSSDENQANTWICEQIKYFIKMHQICIEIFNLTRDLTNIIAFVIIFGAICSSVVTVNSMVIFMETDFLGTIKMLFAFFFTMSSIFLACFPSQILKNASDDLFFTCYEINFLSYPSKIQKMLLFVMIRVMKPFALTAGPTIELNLETCCIMIKSSISYAAAFRSVYTSV